VDAHYWIEKVLAVLLPAGGYFGRMLQEKISNRRIQEQLYREISNNYYATHLRFATALSVEGFKQGAALDFNAKLDTSFHVWNHYKEKDAFFQLKEAGAISRIYEKFHRIKEDLGGYPHVRGKEAMAEVDERLLGGSLERKLYEKVSNPHAWQFMDDLLKGKRESWRKSLNPI